MLRIAGGTGRYADAAERAVFKYLSETTGQVTFTSRPSPSTWSGPVMAGPGRAA